MAWTDNLFRWLGFGRYNSTLPTVADGDTEELQVDAHGRLRVALDTPQTEPTTRYTSSAAERSASAKATGGVAREVDCLSTSASERYLLLIDKATAVAGGDAPFSRSVVPPDGQASITFDGGYTVTNGLQVALSATPDTYTDPGADEGLFYVEMD